MSVTARRWVFRHIADYGIRPGRDQDDFGPYRLAEVLAEFTDHRDPRNGAWPSRDTLAAELGVDPTTVSRWLARLREAGVVEVAPGPPTGQRGRRLNRYLLPGFLASLGLEGTTSGTIPSNDTELEGMDTELEGMDGRIGGHVRAQRPLGGEVLKGGEGKEADASPSPPACINHCKQHRHIPCDEVPKCGACMQRRKSTGRSCRDLADDDRELTRQEVIEILGEDYRQPSAPPPELLDDPEAYQAWRTEKGRERWAERQKRAKATLRARREGRIKPWE